MATNPYFNNYDFTTEQDLMEDIIIESIQIHGIDVQYLPRTLGAKDDLLNEDDLPLFSNNYTVEVYVKNVEGFEGQGDFLSKFGLQIRDSMTFTIAQKRFTDVIGEAESQTMPHEGDIIYFPLNQKMFEIMHVEHEDVFYQTGKLHTYDLRCELLEYNNQRFETGNTVIDTLFANNDTTSNTALTDVESFDPFADNETIQTVANDILNFDENNPFGSDSY